MIKKNVFLINPRVDYRPQPPLGIAYIAAVLENNGYKVEVYDPVRGHDFPSFKKHLIEFDPAIVGITCLAPQENQIHYFARLVREIRPDVPIAAGGVHPTTAHERVLSDNNIDAAVIGEGEITVLNLFERMLKNDDLSQVCGIAFRKNLETIVTVPQPLVENLDCLPLPSRHLLDMGWYSRRLSLIRGKWLRCSTVIAIRGCPFECIFCSSNKVFGRKVRFRSPANVIAEIKNIVEKYKLDAILFVDDTLTLSKEWILELCAIMKKEVPGIKWACQGRVGYIDEQIIKAITSSGCIQIEFGIESGSQKVLDILNKKQTIESIRETFSLCRKFNIRTMANFIIGNPEETSQDIELTSELAKEIKADYTDFFILTPYPGTKIYEMALSNGWLRQGDSFYGRESNKPVMSINFSPEQLVELRKRLYEENISSIWKNYVLEMTFLWDVLRFVFLNPSYVIDIFKVLLREKSFAELGRYINNEISKYGT